MAFVSITGHGTRQWSRAWVPATPCVPRCFGSGFSFHNIWRSHFVSMSTQAFVSSASLGVGRILHSALLWERDLLPKHPFSEIVSISRQVFQTVVARLGAGCLLRSTLFFVVNRKLFRRKIEG